MKQNVKLQKQPNAYSCMPTAFAMLCDIPVSDFIKKIGHDGSEIYWPRSEPPWNTRGFIAPECTIVAFELGFYCHEIVARCEASNGSGTIHEYVNSIDLIYSYMSKHAGVIFGKHLNGGRHAVAWDKELVYDPNYFKTVKEEYQIDSFYIVEKR